MQAARIDRITDRGNVINRLQLLRNIGQFSSVATKANFDKLTLVYAENGRGKTTLASILRSLATGEGSLLLERHRLGAPKPPEVVVACSGASEPARFQNGAWTRTCPEMVVFDDVFIDRNVYSGLEVEADHRQNLHELIIGERGVSLAHRVQELADRIRDINAELRIKTAALKSLDRSGFEIDEFCALPSHADLDNAIDEAEKRVASMNKVETIRQGEAFASLALPLVDVDAIRTVLAKSVADVDAKALARVRTHFAKLGKGAETWIATGMDYTAGDSAGEAACPFCAQPLSSSSMFSAYRAHFATAYKELVKEIETTITHIERTLKGDALAGFERQLQIARTRQLFWKEFCTVPEISISSTELASAWQTARDRLLAALKAKQADPLQECQLDKTTAHAVDRFASLSHEVRELSAALARANEDVDRVRESATSGNAIAAAAELKRLKATRARNAESAVTLCSEYLEAKSAKAHAEAEKATAQEALDAHRQSVFPQYQSAINDYLARFNAGFSVEQVQALNAAGTPSCNYQLGINQHRVPITGATGASFKNTLSAGDRNTLALAFFFASLDRDPRKPQKIVVLDDPVSSLDEHRSLATIQEVRRLVQHVSQVIVLSHSKPFLARIWQHADQPRTTTLQIARDVSGSVIAEWNVKDDAITEYDRRHERLRNFVDRQRGSAWETAQSIRPVLEGYLRVACTADFGPGTLLGPFKQIAKDRAASGNPILTPETIRELEELSEYANKFHHDTNPAWDVEQINDGELQGYVRRTLAFVGP